MHWYHFKSTQAPVIRNKTSFPFKFVKTCDYFLSLELNWKLLFFLSFFFQKVSTIISDHQWANIQIVIQIHLVSSYPPPLPPPHYSQVSRQTNNLKKSSDKVLPVFTNAQNQKWVKSIINNLLNYSKQENNGNVLYILCYVFNPKCLARYFNLKPSLKKIPRYLIEVGRMIDLLKTENYRIVKFYLEV